MTFMLCVMIQAAFRGIVPAENITVVDIISTGGPNNYPYETNNPNNPTEAVGAATEQLIQFLVPTSAKAALQQVLDSNSSAFGPSGVAAVTLTQPTCKASPTGVCAPGTQSHPATRHRVPLKRTQNLFSLEFPNCCVA